MQAAPQQLIDPHSSPAPTHTSPGGWQRCAQRLQMQAARLPRQFGGHKRARVVTRLEHKMQQPAVPRLSRGHPRPPRHAATPARLLIALGLLLRGLQAKGDTHMVVARHVRRTQPGAIAGVQPRQLRRRPAHLRRTGKEAAQPGPRRQTSRQLIERRVLRTPDRARASAPLFKKESNSWRGGRCGPQVGGVSARRRPISWRRIGHRRGRRAASGQPGAPPPRPPIARAVKRGPPAGEIARRVRFLQCHPTAGSSFCWATASSNKLVAVAQ